jgi:hypothetical protein
VTSVEAPDITPVAVLKDIPVKIVPETITSLDVGIPPIR